MEIEKIKKYMINKNNPNGDGRNSYSSGWYAGSQVEALKFYLSKKIIFLIEHKEGSYQGEYGVVFFVDDKFYLWRSSFGSCSGCDGLEGNNGYEYIEDTLKSIKEFNELGEIIEYLKSDTHDYLYSELEEGLSRKINGLLDSLKDVPKKDIKQMIQSKDLMKKLK